MDARMKKNWVRTLRSFPHRTMTVMCGHCGKTMTGPVYSDVDWLGLHLDTCSTTRRDA